MLKRLHKWLAWSVGIWLLLICLSGSILLYKNDILPLMYPALKVDTELVEVGHSLQTNTQIEALSAFLSNIDSDPDMAYVILASQDIPWHLAVDAKGNNHYFNHQGEWLLTRSDQQDWLAWIRAFHMHLLLHNIGEEILGLIAIACFALMLTGLIYWWPKRFTKRLFALPTRFKHPKTYRQWHTVLGVLSFTPLFIIIFTSVALLYFSAFKTVLVTWIDGYEAKPQNMQIVEPSTINWQNILSNVERDFPKAELRLLSLNQDNLDKVALRIKTSSEWHPNGRSTLLFDKNTSTLVDARLAHQMGLGETFLNTLYPLHIGSVGSIYWLGVLTILGVVPMVLMLMGYWLRKKQKSNILR